MKQKSIPHNRIAMEIKEKIKKQIMLVMLSWKPTPIFCFCLNK